MKPDSYRTLRQSVGTQKAVAKKLGVDKQTISDRECGRVRISREAGYALKWVRLKLNVEELA